MRLFFNCPNFFLMPLRSFDLYIQKNGFDITDIFWSEPCKTGLKSLSAPYTHWSISVKKWQKLFQVKMAPNFTKFEWYQQWKASQGLKNWLKAIKDIKASVQARYEKKLNFHNFFTWLWLFGPKNSCGALGLTKKVHKGQKGHYKARS